MAQRPKMAHSCLMKMLKIELPLKRMPMKEQLPNPGSPTPAAVESQCLLQTDAL